MGVRWTGRTAAVLALTGIMLGGCASAGGAVTPGEVAPPTGDAATTQPAAGGPQDKAGSQTVVLKLVSNDPVSGNGQAYGLVAFVSELESVSGGRLKADVTDGFGYPAPDAENQLVKAIASGEYDGGWPSVRAFARAGIHGLEAVEAPLTLTSYAAIKALVSSPVAADLLAQLKGSGLVGLGLVVGPLRRPFAAQAPLLGPATWTGAAIRSFNSPVQDATLTELGATPVDATTDWVDRLNAGTLRGLEFDIGQYADNGLSTETPFVTANVVLWPKVFVLTLSQQRWDTLTDQQRSWVQEAATAAMQASIDATYDESTPAASLCARGVRFIDASAADLAALKEAVAPVVAGLAADPVNGPILAGIQAIAAQYPTPEAPQVPSDCRQIPSPSPTAGGIPTQASKLPNGTYRQQVTRSDVDRLGIPFDLGATGTWTLKAKDGTFQLSCRFTDDPSTDCGHSHADGAIVEAGFLRGTGHTAYFVGDLDTLRKLTDCLLPVSMALDGHCVVISPYRLDWSLDGDQLTFSNPGGDPDSQQYVAVPWTRIN